MCSRYHINGQVQRILSVLPGYRDFRTGDVRPGDEAPVIVEKGGRKELFFMRWGFHPEAGKGTVFNARAESVGERVLFRDGFSSRRIAVPAASFYEWNQKKEKSRFENAEEFFPMYLAGIWRREEDGDHFVVLTTEANASMSPVHDRMPLILDPDEVGRWCGTQAAAEEILKKKPRELRRYTEYEQLSLFCQEKILDSPPLL